MASINAIVGKATIIGVFFLYAGGIILIVGDVESSRLAKVIWSSIYVVTFFLIYRSSLSVLTVVRRNLGFMFLALLCLASVAWSSDRSTTVSHSIALFGSTMLGYLIVTKIEPVELLRRIGFALLILLAINMVLMVPNFGGNLSSSIRYEGLFPHPNMLGRISGLAVLMFLILVSCRCFSFMWGCLGVGMGGILLISCGSMTSTIALCGAFGLFLLRRVLGKQPLGGGGIAVAIWFMLCFGGVIWVSWSAIIDFAFELMGRSSTLTGRTKLWEGVWAAVLKEPILGYGYSAFWGGEQFLTSRIFASAGWRTSSAHNGLLSIALSLGVVGVLVFVMTVGRSVVIAVKLAFSSASITALLLLSILSYLLILGIAESSYMGRNSIYWMLCVICCIYIRQIEAGELSAELMAEQGDLSPSSEENL